MSAFGWGDVREGDIVACRVVVTQVYRSGGFTVELDQSHAPELVERGGTPGQRAYAVSGNLVSWEKLTTEVKQVWEKIARAAREGQ